MSLGTYEVFAIKYAERDARRPDNFVGGDPHDVPMPMDYFIWLIRNEERLVLQRYPAVTPDLEGIAVRLDVMPHGFITGAD